MEIKNRNLLIGLGVGIIVLVAGYMVSQSMGTFSWDSFKADVLRVSADTSSQQFGYAGGKVQVTLSTGLVVTGTVNLNSGVSFKKPSVMFSILPGYSANSVGFGNTHVYKFRVRVNNGTGVYSGLTVGLNSVTIACRYSGNPVSVFLSLNSMPWLQMSMSTQTSMPSGISTKLTVVNNTGFAMINSAPGSYADFNVGLVSPMAAVGVTFCNLTDASITEYYTNGARRVFQSLKVYPNSFNSNNLPPVKKVW